MRLRRSTVNATNDNNNNGNVLLWIKAKSHPCSAYYTTTRTSASIGYYYYVVLISRPLRVPLAAYLRHGVRSVIQTRKSLARRDSRGRTRRATFYTIPPGAANSLVTLAAARSIDSLCGGKYKIRLGRAPPSHARVRSPKRGTRAIPRFPPPPPHPLTGAR